MYSWKFLHTCLWFPQHNLIPWFHDNQMNWRYWWKGGEITGISSRGFYEKHKGNRERLLRIFANWTKLRWNKGNEQVRARSSRHPRHAQREQRTLPVFRDRPNFSCSLATGGQQECLPKALHPSHGLPNGVPRRTLGWRPFSHQPWPGALHSCSQRPAPLS